MQTLQQSLSKLFNKDQLDAMSRRSTRGLKWQPETVKKALRLRFSCGTTGYNELLKTGMPLPSVRTLQERMQEIDFSPGVLNTVFQYLATKVGRVTVVSYVMAWII